MQSIKYVAALLPTAVFLHLLNQGSAVVLGRDLAEALVGFSSACSAGVLFGLTIVGLVCLVFLIVVGLAFGSWLLRSLSRHGGLRCGLYLGETFSGLRHYLDYPGDRGDLVRFKVNGAGNPGAQSFRHVFRYHLLDEAGGRLEQGETGVHHGIEQLIVNLITLWLVFIFIGLAFLPTAILELLRPPHLQASGNFLSLQSPYADQVFLPAMPGLALAFAATLALGLAALWRRHRLLVHYEETRPNANARPRVQSGEVLEGRIIERSRIDPIWYRSPHVGYSLEVTGQFERPVILGFTVAAAADCPLYSELERAAAAHGKVRVRVDPHARIRPLSETLAEIGEGATSPAGESGAAQQRPGRAR